MLNSRDAPLDILGGGGVARVFVVCKLFFLPQRENNLFLWRSTSDNFYLCFVEEIFCRMLSLLCRLPFGVPSGQRIFHKLDKLFFSARIFDNLFFLTFVATNYFFQFFSRHTSPPPQISNGASLTYVEETWRQHLSWCVQSLYIYSRCNSCGKLCISCHWFDHPDHNPSNTTHWPNVGIYNVGPPSTTLSQLYTNIGWMTLGNINQDYVHKYKPDTSSLTTKGFTGKVGYNDDNEHAGSILKFLFCLACWLLLK